MKITTPDFEWRNGRQYFATIIANLIMLAQGCILGWFSPALPYLISENSPLTSGPLTSVEVSWIGAMINVGAMCGGCMFGFITALLGCKRAMLALALPSIIFWILIFYGDTYYYILFGRFLSGWTAGGIQTTVVLYTSEISNNNIRGRLGSFMQISRNVGVLAAYIVGAYVEYNYIPCIFVFVPLLYLATFYFLPNTPQFYLQRNQIQEAQESLKYYKSYKGKTQLEIDAFNCEFERIQGIANEQHTDEKLNIRHFMNRPAIKGMVIGLALAYFGQLTGCFTIITYAVFILETTGTQLDSYKCSIALAVMLILGNLCTTKLGDAMGRRVSMTITLLGSAVGLIGLSAFIYLVQIGYDLSAFPWIPIACLSFVVFISSAGIIPLSHVARVENLPTKIRTVGLSICIFGLNLTSFACTKLFPILLKKIGLHGCMMIFAVNCIIGAFFTYFALSETTGKPMDTLKEQPNQKESNDTV